IERAAHLVADDDPAHGRRDDLLDLAAQLAWQLVGKGERETAGPLRVHQHARALQVEGAVPARRQYEVAVEQRVAGAEFSENLVFGHGGEVAFRSVDARSGKRPGDSLAVPGMGDAINSP